MTGLLQDLRLSVRQLLSRPGFAAAAVLTLGLGIGANTAIFSIVNAVFLRPLPIPDIDRIINIYTTDSQNQQGGFSTYLPVSYLNLDDIKAGTAGLFDDVAATSGVGLTLGSDDGARAVAGLMVTANYFDVLGVTPAVGRTFVAEEDEIGTGQRAVVLSHSLWVRQYGGSADIIGREVPLNGVPFTVIGVMPAGFKGTATLATQDQVWVTTGVYKEVTSGLYRDIFRMRRAVVASPIARLADGVSITQVRSALASIGERLAREYPTDNGNRTFIAETLADSAIGINQRGQFMQAGSLLMAVVGVVLLVACVNLVSLLLARSATRRAEMTVRVAMGADRQRLVRQLLTESLVLGMAGAVVGIVLAYVGTAWLWSMRPPFLAADAVALDFDWRVLAFTAAVAIGAALGVGLLPAWRATRVDLAQVLRAAGRSGHGDSTTHRMLKGLVVVEVALAVVAVAGAGLFLRSLQRAHEIDPGFQSERLLAMVFGLPDRDYTPERGLQFYRDLVEQLNAQPGVQAASVATSFPLGGSQVRSIFTEEMLADTEARGIFVNTASIDDGFFEALEIPVVTGRTFNEGDRTDARAVAIVNETFARRFWPDQDPIGRKAAFFAETTLREVVGVVKDVAVNQLGETPQAFIYVPMRQVYSPNVVLQVRTAGDPAAMLTPVTQTVQALDRNLSVGQALTIGQVLDQTLWSARTGAQLLGLFSALTLVLVVVGIHGVFGYTVAQRTSEVGLRLALGAEPGRVRREVVTSCLQLTAIGLVVGGGATVLLAQLVSGLLYGVTPADPMSIGAAVIILTLVAFAASYLPSRRAARVEPLEALRG